ncbi:hypothetical protein SAMD00019534_080190 [Acytostelium subglobosum LB1]|uniref:hypothetical protein n=1 Tax=Acytostelium subglobosum LB1 TaxID=1410327 RepID=UPI0006451E36|nr:hypothetical protein SAMD00019534_080190 [Acytostelium subglobosum LB1]GAM24844.1 hypothetical protein SAMD00019534_080190 [Acytostelium subglobosum LB1]|eukprot:XP_012751933.1 hypothetical protein SAMD00019534_080190 [Acytostelium subglobosum LB1]
MVRLFSRKSKGSDVVAINNAFQVVLDEMGFQEEDRKKMMEYDIERKQKYIASYKSKLISKSDFTGKKPNSKAKPVLHSPQYFVDGLKATPTMELLTSLRVRLGNQPIKWFREFCSLNGVETLIKVLNDIDMKPTKTPEDMGKMAQCLHSLKFTMNNRVGLEAVIKNPTSIASIALILDTTHLKSRIMVLEMLAALCVLHPKGRTLVLAAMDNYREVKRETKPYLHLVQSLTNASSPQAQFETFALINTLISTADNVEDRVNIRSQFKRIGIVKAIQDLADQIKINPDLANQVDIFEHEDRWDEQEHMENARGDISDDNPDSLFRNLKDRTTGGPLFPPFVSILKMLLKTVSDEDSTEEQSLSNCLFVEKILSKINGGSSVLNDDLSSFFGESMDISHVSGEKAVLIQKEIEDLKKDKKRAAEQLHEKDILLTKLAKKLMRLEDAIRSGRGMEVLAEEEEKDDELIKIAAVSEGSSKASIKTLKDGIEEKPKIGGDGNFLSALDAPPVDPATDDSSGPPPPPLPPGVPPPPPPPGMMKAPATPERCSRAPSVKMKSYQWTRYRTRNIPNTFWTKVNYSKYNDDLPYEQIEQLFAAAVFEKKEKEVNKKACVTLIDSKRAQNIGILLSRFKGFTHDHIYNAIFNMDEKVLDLETINQFVKYVPTKEEIDLINAFKVTQAARPEEERQKYGKAEEFIDKIASIPKLAQRINAIHFKLNFPEKLYQAKPDVRTFNQAMNDLQNENLFEVLELILSVGNFINHGTNRGNASGFKIDSINKMADTKSNTREKYNLVHYLIELLESIKPSLLSFYEEIPNVYTAATLSFSTSTGEIRLLKSGLAKLELEVNGTDNTSPLDDKDPFRLKLSEFLLSAKTELLDAEKLVGETEMMYGKIAKFFGEDTTRPLEEFCAIFKKFSDTYQLAKKDLEREKAMSERAAKRKNDRKANQEVQKKKIVDDDDGDDVSSTLKSTDGKTTKQQMSKENAEDKKIQQYLESVQLSPGSSCGSEGEGMMEDILNMIRDGDFGTLRRNRMNANKVKPPKAIPVIPEDTPSTFSSLSSKFDAKPLDISSDEDEEDEDATDETGEEYEDDDDVDVDDEEEDGSTSEE